MYNLKVAATLENTANLIMNKEFNQFMKAKFKSCARIVGSNMVEVTAPDGEIFQVLCHVGMYLSEDTRKYELHRIEYIFDKCFSEDKELMANNIWRESSIQGITFLGISSGNRQGERIRLGGRIRQIREERKMEARELAKLAGIDAANLSRIENGKYSVGIDILSKIAAALGKKIDLVDL